MSLLSAGQVTISLWVPGEREAQLPIDLFKREFPSYNDIDLEAVIELLQGHTHSKRHLAACVEEKARRAGVN
jgi:hypothetical protein